MPRAPEKFDAFPREEESRPHLARYSHKNRRPVGKRRGRDTGIHIELSSEVHRANTLVPTDVIAGMAATTIRPTIRAYCSSSAPGSGCRWV